MEYWNRRFVTGDWARSEGYQQTRSFAEAQIPLYGIPGDFAGTLCDFGCGAGDAIPVYREAFPKSKLIGVDFSAAAIDLATQRYGSLAEFVCGDIAQVPDVDVIVCSNTIEHIENDKDLANQLLQRCSRLFLIVPHREQYLISEHLRSYDEHSFDAMGPTRHVVFHAKGWSEYGVELYWNIYLKNVVRTLLRRPVWRRNRQILFEFRGFASGTPRAAPGPSAREG